MTIANNFVTDKNSGEVMTVGWVQNLIKPVKLSLNVEKYFSFLNRLQLIPVIRTMLSSICLNKTKLGQYFSIKLRYFCWQRFKFPRMMGFCA